MSVLHSLIGRRYFLASTLAGTFGAVLPVTAARADKRPRSPADTEMAPSAPATAGGVSVVAAAASTQPSGDTSIAPFQFHASDEALADLRRRIAVTKWPEQETVADATQGVQLATMRALAPYWQTDYDWRKVEARLNALPQFVTNIDGLDIHFIHVRSKLTMRCR